MRPTSAFSLATASIALFSLLDTVLAQDGDLTGPTTTQEAAGYSCDPNKCKLPDCACASPNIPGGIPHDQTPQFILFTADDAVQSYTINAVNNILGNRRNPNGCSVKMTYFTQILYTNMSMVTDFYVAGNEVADHTMTHPALGGTDEINGNLVALNAMAGIPFNDITGFRAPFLNYSAEMLKNLAAAGFKWDSSATASIAVTDNGTDAYWPYTLDNGMSNDCTTFLDVCQGEPKIPGFWEIPMYAIFDGSGPDGLHLMDPWLDSTPDNVSQWMRNTFADHYNANRQPFGLYTHPIHIATGYPGVADPTGTIDMINSFLDWAQEQANVWIVTNSQLLDWVRDPKPVSELNSIPSFQCAVPKIEDKICNGMPANEQGLLSHCAFNDFPWYTCYGCPEEQPSPANPNPSQPAVSGAVRYRLPDNCATAFWDPIGNKCLCQNGTSCQFDDQTRPIGPNGKNLSGGGTGQTPATTSYIPFDGSGMGGAPRGAGLHPGAVLVAGMVSVFCVLVGAMATMSA